MHEKKTHKLSKANKENIRRSYVHGHSAQELAEIYEVNPTTIFRALKVNGKNPIKFKVKPEETLDYLETQKEILANTYRIIDLLERILEVGS